MSWIIGVVPKIPLDFDKILSAIDNDKKFTYKSKSFQIYAGSSTNNLHLSKGNYADNKGWIISGIGLQNNIEDTKILEHSDWNRLLKEKNKIEKINNLDGHFIIVEWNDKFVSINSDVLGLRDIYIVENKNGIFFSTNVFWLSKFINL